MAPRTKDETVGQYAERVAREKALEQSHLVRVATRQHSKRDPDKTLASLARQNAVRLAEKGVY